MRSWKTVLTPCKERGDGQLKGSTEEQRGPSERRQEHKPREGAESKRTDTTGGEGGKDELGSWDRHAHTLGAEYKVGD